MRLQCARADRTESVSEAVDRVHDGDTIAIGGFINASHPMHVVREIVRRGLRGLRVVGAASSGLEIDLLIAGGCVREVVAPYVGAEKYSSIGPVFRWAVQSGVVAVWEVDEAMYYAGLRAAAQRLPFNPWLAGIGTSFPVVNTDLKVFQDPVAGKRLLAIPAIEIDVAFVHASASDSLGDVQYVGTGWGDKAQYAAANATVAQVERIVPVEEVRKAPERTLLPGVDAVVRAQFGAHPFSSPGYYREDERHIALLVAAGTRLLKDADDGDIKRYLNEYVYGVDDEIEYLEKVGIRRLLSLSEY